MLLRIRLVYVSMTKRVEKEVEPLLKWKKRGANEEHKSARPLQKLTCGPLLVMLCIYTFLDIPLGEVPSLFYCKMCVEATNF